MISEFELYNGCLRAEEKYQKALFDAHLSAMYTVCLRYVGATDVAEDLVQEGFVKIFTKIESFTWQGNNSFLKWMKTVFINLAINEYRKNAKEQKVYIEDSEYADYSDDETQAESEFCKALELFSHDDILQCIQELPEQFRIVFNLFAVEGMKHKDIAELLNIPIQTSTTRYLRAKDKLKLILQNKMTASLQLY